ncbi:LysR family transcriptional regulator [Pseudogracilibacillus auburnensis]|uniref:LysR family transcriptional regulator n=1 Tax=Pseudogracilibacillus auburnensis TaxID=1494959 RepID=A0A2V3VT23_9BACI|nr:LysR family transcriptional regulator [Pseudogracilibacillus auburnensis]MBO1004275.1 LysR family transcriptional regulator [Pseudogracilibacillus auburnensis]PXW85027.1 LysR family transcriptional regulator [Pseudogracilibacillus auburnensis]
MNIRDLVIFQTVANYGSINKAAKELSYVQSNVTSRIQKLEQDLNVQLFHRHQRGITLTNEGNALLPYVQKIISLTDKMKMISADNNSPSGKLDIASVETVIKLPLILSAYIKKYKQVDLTLSTGVTVELKEKVLNYKLDGAFVTKGKITNDPNLMEIDVFHEKLVLIASNETKSLEEIIELPILRFSDGCGYRAKLNEWLYDETITPSKVMELGTLETTLGSVISGLGIAYVPYSAVETYATQNLIRCYELPEKYSHITTIFIYRKSDYVTPALQKFIETIEETKTLYKKG